MKVAEAIAHALTAEGVTLAAGITGQSIGHVADSLAERNGVSLIYARQERVAFDICDGFARTCGTPAVMFADAGPAAANATGGLVNSWGDSIPVLFFAGHNDRFELASGQTKEIPFRALFSPVSKWVAIIEDPSQVGDIIRRAFMHLRTGRTGPVVLGMPYDVSSMEMGSFDYTPVGSQPRVRGAADPAAVNDAIDLLAQAERPYLYVGAGVLASEATDALVRLAELLTLPVATTLNGKSAFPENHPLALGIGGYARATYSSLPATVLGEKADVILTIGCGFKKHAVKSAPARGARHIQVDVDITEINKYHLADVAMVGDAKVVIEQLLAAAKTRIDPARLKPNAARLREVQSLRQRWDEVSAPLTRSDEVPINPFRVTHELAKAVDPDRTIVLHDAGSVRGSTCQHYIATRPRSFLGFGVQSAMGWSIGAGIGAKKAAPDKLVVSVIGEEAMNETAMDIETSIRSNAPILIVVKNNRPFADRDGGSSKRLAHARFNQGVDICALATALGAKSFRATDPAALPNTFAAAIAEVNGGTTAVVEIPTTRVKTSLHGLWEAGKK